MKNQWLAFVCGGLLISSANAQTVIDGFEYSSDDELLAAWVPSGGAQLTMSDVVATGATGKKSMRVDFNFASVEWATETIRGTSFATPLTIAPNQYLTFRLRGDPAFAKSDFHNLYLYAYDVNGNFGRWPTTTPANDQWQIVNSLASSIELPWDSTVAPDLSQLDHFSFFQYGSQAAIDPYTATVYIDDLTVRDTPLTEFEPPSAPRQLIDNFESYTDDTALRNFYSYENGSAASVTTASLFSPAPEGNKALKLAIDLGAGQWPWGSVRSATVAPFSFPTNAVVSVRIKGDPTLALVDGGTTFWLSFYDKAGHRMNYISPAAPVVSADWTNLVFSLADFGNTATVDIGNLVQWRILVEGWEGTVDQPAQSAVFYIDDIRITVPSAQRPTLAVERQAGGLTLNISNLTPGTDYEVRRTTNLSQWTTATVINSTSATATWTIPTDAPAAFYQLVQKTSP